jgi:predicted permease
MLFAESLWLAALGGGLGIGIGVLATRLLPRLEVAGLPRSGEIGVDASTLAFALLLSVSSTLVFGLAPAWRTARPDLHKEAHAGRATLDPSRLRVNHLLVVGQLAVSLVLLAGAGLLGASLARLQGLEPGFEATNALTFSVTAPGSRYERPLGTDRLFRALEDRVRQLPGVEGAGVVWPLPLSGRVWSNHYAAGAVRDAERAYAEYRMATPAYFEAARIPLVEGRLFRADDRPNVVVVNRKVAERAWPGEAAVGRTLQARPWGPPDEVFEVVGVVEDVRNADLREPPSETLYFDSRGWSWTDWEVSYVVRAATDPMALVSAIRRELAGLDPEIPLAEVRLLSDLVDGQLSPNRFALALLGVFAASAGALALVGLYGLVSYTVSRRGREVGIRVALGASRRQIASLVLGQAGGLAASGVALGLLAAFGLTRLLGALLFGVSPLEPTVLVAAAAGLGIAALAAALAPARRAASVDPVEALKAE